VDKLYQAQILDRSQHPQFGGEVADATHRSEGANLSCGDEVSWTAQIADDKIITKLRHQTRACAVCAASADLLAEQLQGKPLPEISRWNTERVQEMLGIPLSPVRLKCALLPLEALKELEQA
jgi:nitrogen fixation protein NifU and related proteins